MGRKLLALVPSTLPLTVNFGRFHSDAIDNPLTSLYVWTSRPSTESTRSRQLALDRSRHQLLELQRLQSIGGSRSWFVGNSVVQDGALIVFTPIDSLFLLLDAASGQRTRFLSVYDLLARDNNTWLLQLQTFRLETINVLCDVQLDGVERGIDDLYIKINESKVISWLKAKVEKVALVLATHKLDASKHASAIDESVYLPGYPKKELKTVVTQEDIASYYREAIDVIGDYLSNEWVEALCNTYKCSVEQAKSEAKIAPHDAFTRFDRRQATDNGPKRPKGLSVSGAKKKSKLANVDRTGMKLLTSFFGK
ncbi:uncharacterized protein CCR75_004306 [Bremia lactucae]|uniref:Ribonuclease H2 subunit B n=1 Tax=Bremia lactucae TaxID=4779 RepID=A0A976IJL5_BRELC|nr:hypothetical protein CCR75_004306 [Bremia lactucae]